MTGDLIPDTFGFRPIPEFSGQDQIWPRGRQLAEIRRSASEFNRRFKRSGQVVAAQSVDLVAAAYPSTFAFAGAARGLNPYVSIVNRLVVVQFHDFAGALRTLVWEPTIPEGSAKAPFYAQLIDRYGDFLSNRVFKTEYHSVTAALAQLGIAAEAVDYVAFDHLHVQDLRLLLGTTQPIPGELEARPALFPNAVFICQEREVATLRDCHPMQVAWYVPGGLDQVIEDRMLLINGDLELGAGLALIATPGHTDGNQSLVLNSPDGVWVSSENGVAIDNWYPEHSRIPGLRAYSRFYGREVVLNSNTLEDSIDQYNSMVKEKTVADPSPRDPRLANLLPSSELARFIRHWPVHPSLVQGGFQYGELQK